ncbi:MAG: DJ-1/PfpI family protein [Alphaproteobacteria bacterium]|nr:DJ-1/PfpI family protein [Alphaproteobacteria bacterium]
MSEMFRVGFLIFPDITQLDMTGPYQVFANTPGTALHLIWKTKDPITAQGGMQIVPDTSFAECPQLDLICVPGGSGVAALMEDSGALHFLRTQAESAKYVTSVCTGSLVLAAAGLLDGYRAACHWQWRELLEPLGAIPDEGRVVTDGNRITGGGVTAGIDFGLTVVAKEFGEAVAKAVQLGIEYDPAPPFNSGSPKTASPETLETVRQASQKMREAREALIERVIANRHT